MTEPTAEEIAAQTAAAEKAKAEAESSSPIQLPADHPLVKTLAAQKEAMKELKAKAAKLDAFEEANKTELQKQQDRAEAAEKALAEREAADAKAKAEADAAEALLKVRDEVAKTKGVPAAILHGTSKEGFEKHADELIAAGIKPAPGPSSDGQGNVGDQVSTNGEMSAEDIVKAATSR